MTFVKGLPDGFDATHPPADIERRRVSSVNPVGDLTYEILTRVYYYISKTGVYPQNEIQKKGIHTTVFDFNTWQAEYRFFDPEAKSDRIFETVIRIVDSMNWISPYEITLTLFSDYGTNIKLRDFIGNQPNLSSRNIKNSIELKERVNNEATSKTFFAFSELDLSSVYAEIVK